MVKCIVTILLLCPSVMLKIYTDCNYTGLKIKCARIYIGKTDKFTSKPLSGNSCVSASCLHYVPTFRKEL